MQGDTMKCSDVRSRLLARRNGTLAAEQALQLDEHLANCEQCQSYERADAQLSRVLEAQLPPLSAPAALRQSLTTRYATRAWWRQPVSRTVAAAMAGAALTVVVMTYAAGSTSIDTMLREATNDHLRILYSDQPLEVISSSSHTVKPWFAGRVDFAPVVPFEGDQEFTLQGGTIAYFIDRKAAVYEYQCRLHKLSLLIFRSDGLTWPSISVHWLGLKGTLFRSSRGFNTLLWRSGDLGYALVSDIDRADLERLGAKLGAGR